MNKTKKWILICSIGLSTLFLGACGPYERFRSGHWGFHHKFHGKDFSDRVFKRMDKKVKKLDLSEEQQKKYTEIKEAVRADMEEMAQSREDLMREIKNEFDKNNPDMEKVAAVMKLRMERMPGMMEKHIDHFLDFYNMLNDDQRSQVMEWIRKKGKRWM